MISWMQKHRKYLVVTIWISTIAFVGAGFVGWGAYSFNDSSNSAATVGEEKITYKDLQREYSKLFSTYQQMFNGKFDEKQAKELRLQEVALDNLINKAYFINLAKDLGLEATKEDIAKELAKTKYFQENGKFSKEVYIKSLQTNGLKPNDYESMLKESLTLQKLFVAIKPTVNKNEQESVLSTFFMRDKVKVSVINGDNLKLEYKEDELKAFWEKNKNNYMTDEKVELEIYKTALIDTKLGENELKKYYEENRNSFLDNEDKIKSFDDAKEEVKEALRKKLTKKEANKNFYKFKNGELKATDTKSITINSLSYDVDSMQKIVGALSDDILKPIEVEDGYEIIKIKNKIQPQPKTFENAKKDAKKEFETTLSKDLLEKNAKLNLESFDGKSIGFISRDSKISIDGLEDSEVAIFINKLFTKNSKKDYIIVNNKAVIYEIVSQKLSKKSDIDDMFNENIINIKESLLDNNMLKMLSDKYPVQKYVK
jgi:peptidyl-prolyl cis-trans isomerase D